MLPRHTLHPLDGSYTLMGERRPPVYNQTLEIRSPVDGTALGAVHEFSPAEIDAVLERCAADQPAWAGLPLGERTAVLHRLAGLLEDHLDELADLLVMEIAKPRRDARDEVSRSADLLRLTAEEAGRVAGDPLPGGAVTGARLTVAYRVPLGTVLAIVPFNFPLHLSAAKLAPALASGNAVVLKPPTQGSLSCTLLAQLALAAGAPAGVFHLVTGRGVAVGDHLVQHPGVDMVSFTGSSETGTELARRAAMVPLTLELGGKDPAIVLADADLEAAAAEIVSAALGYSGQRCAAGKRVLAVEPVAGELVERLRARVERLSVGDPRRDCDITPLVDPASADRALALVDQAVRMGAVQVCGGGRQGTLLEPLLLDHVTEHMDLAWVDPFAPVLPVIRVPQAAAAVDLANRADFTLQAAVFGRDLDLAAQVALSLEAGTVQVNGHTARGPAHAPFTGDRSTAMAGDGLRPALESMTRLKSVVVTTRPRDLTDPG